MFSPSPQLAEAIRLLAESRAELKEMLGDDYVERPPSANPMEDAMRGLVESRAMLDEVGKDGDEATSGDDNPPSDEP